MLPKYRTRTHAALAALLLTLGLGTLPLPREASAQEANPAAAGFDFEGADSEAIAIADQVMEAMGGRRAWDETRHLRWKFFGRRLHVWDKQTGDLRIEGIGREDERPFVILMNLRSKEGRAWVAGEPVEDAEQLAQKLDFGEAVWINDSYWMFMPYKLKDSGVTLTYHGEGRMQDGRSARVLELTFRDVGRTPENMYHVYVADDSGLVEQWDYYAKATDPEPRFQIPWRDWRRFGRILLSDDRGESSHSDLRVFDALPDSVYSDPAAVDWSSIE